MTETIQQAMAKTGHVKYYLAKKGSNRSARMESTSFTALQKVKGSDGEYITRINFDDGSRTVMFRWVDGKWSKQCS